MVRGSGVYLESSEPLCFGCTLDPKSLFFPPEHPLSGFWRLLQQLPILLLFCREIHSDSVHRNQKCSVKYCANTNGSLWRRWQRRFFHFKREFWNIVQIRTNKNKNYTSFQSWLHSSVLRLRLRIGNHFDRHCNAFEMNVCMVVCMLDADKVFSACHTQFTSPSIRR